jgi:hypothetical protein
MDQVMCTGAKNVPDCVKKAAAAREDALSQRRASKK